MGSGTLGSQEWTNEYLRAGIAACIGKRVQLSLFSLLCSLRVVFDYPITTIRRLLKSHSNRTSLLVIDTVCSDIHNTVATSLPHTVWLSKFVQRHSPSCSVLYTTRHPASGICIAYPRVPFKRLSVRFHCTYPGFS